LDDGVSFHAIAISGFLLDFKVCFVRERNALVVRANFEVIYRDYYLHLMQHQIKHGESHDDLIKDALAALALHLASRPRNESVAWTLSWQDPAFNLFVTGSNRMGNVIGRLFTEDVKPRDTNLFISQATADGQEARQSTIEAKEKDYFSIVEDYYHQSEQRPARLFRYEEEDFVMVCAQPDCDLDWFHSLNNESIRELDQAEELSLLEKRVFTFDCGCSIAKLLPVITSLSEEAQNEVFGDGDEPAIITCPRCAARYILTREMVQVFLERQDSA